MSSRDTFISPMAFTSVCKSDCASVLTESCCGGAASAVEDEEDEEEDEGWKDGLDGFSFGGGRGRG